MSPPAGDVVTEARAAGAMQVDIGDALLATHMEGSGDPVALVSGFDGRAAFWRHQVPVLAARHRVVAYDQRGTGLSTHSRIRYSIQQMAEDLVSVLEALGLERAAFVGHGLGSAVLLELAASHRELVTKLALLAPWAGPSPALDSALRERERLLKSGRAEDYARLEARDSLPAAWSAADPTRFDELLHDRIAGLADPDVEASRLRAARAFNLRARLPSLRVPTLVISAADDRLVPPGDARDVASAMPIARFETLERGGHYCPLAEAEGVNTRLLEFLQR